MAASPTQASLDRALERATQVRIKDVPQLGGTEHLLITDPDSVRQLARLLIIEPPATPFHCMCFGNQLLEFAVPWRRDVCITLHHGCSIRWQQWDSDALLADGEALLRWLADRGWSGPLQEWQADRRRADEDRLAWQAWRSAAPRALAPFLENAELASVNPEYPPEALIRAEQAHRAACADERTAMLQLVDWYGSGGGPWSGFPSYQSVAEALLLRYPTAALVEALGGQPLVAARAEGLARLLSSWWFGRLRPGEASAVPEELRQLLLAHVVAGGDADKRARLAHALEPVGTV
ncbi:MAG: hypothetical protein A2138_03095 [Deltaproteobacteria bacterium RBG_16_71_12]|nr:MAG: hypothetical protein A2138_03095 [Deltaproteobacteria bacterium RBG_16_71_12]